MQGVAEPSESRIKIIKLSLTLLIIWSTNYQIILIMLQNARCGKESAESRIEIIKLLLTLLIIWLY